MRRLRALAGAVVLTGFGLSGTAAGPAPGPSLEPSFPPPQRVVSMNLCTDQMAMLLAAPGQLISVSMLAQEARSSAMAEEAKAWPVNHGLAEEIFLLDPDLVLAGSFSSAATLGLLERLGIRTAQLPPAYALEEIPALLRQTGALLGREVQAEALAQDFEADLAVLRAPSGGTGLGPPRAALYEANGYAPGERSLGADLLRAAGFAPVSAEFDLEYGGFLPLELLVLAEPDLLVAGRPRSGAEGEGASRGEEILVHPALEALRNRAGGTPILPDRDWVCGLPATLRAAARLAEARRLWEAKR